MCEEVNYMIITDIEEIAKDNTYFRRVLCTGQHSQVVVMSIPVGSEIGDEVHPNTDQILFIVDGTAEAIVNNEVRRVEEDDVVFVPAGSRHNIKNIDDEELKLFTVYAPAQHKDGTIHKTKEEAEQAEGTHL